MHLHRFDTRLLLALCLALTPWLAGCGSKEDRIAEGLRKGAAFVLVADWQKAGLEVRNVLQMDPKNAQAYYVSGRIDEGRGELQRAFGAYRKAIELAPTHRAAQVATARIYLLAGDLPNADDLLRQVLSAEPQHAGARTVSAALLAARGDTARAKTMATELLAPGAEPAPDASMLLAGLHANAGDLAQAQRVIEQALAQSPQHLPLLQVAAQIAAAPNAPPAVAARADGWFRQAAEAAPKNDATWLAWAAHHERKGAFEAAETVLRAASTAQPDDGARQLALLDFLARRRGNAVAAKAFEGAIAQRPRDMALRLALAELQRSAGQISLAERTWREVIDKAAEAPAALDARNRLAESRLRAGQVDEAVALVAQVLAKSPRDTAGLLLRSRLHMAAARPAEAVTDLRAALKDQPASPDIVGRLAQAHHAAGQPQLAREVLGEAVRFAPGNADLRLLLATDLLDKREWRNAEIEINAALAAAPANLRGYDLKALLSRARNERDGGEKVYTEMKARVPGSVVPHLRLAQWQADNGKADAALKTYDAAMAVFPAAPEPRVAAVALLLAQRRFDAAAARADAMARAEPRNVLPQQLLGDVAIARGQPAEAVRHYGRMVELAPTLAAGYTQVARAQMLAGQGDAAMATLARGEKALPDDLSLPVARAQWLARLNRTDEAIALFDTLHQRAPEDDSVANNLGYLLAQTRGDPASLKRALALTERFVGSAVPGHLDSLGWAHFKLGQYERAVPILERAVALAPGDPLMQMHLGLALHRSGDAARGRELLRKALLAKATLPGADEARRIVAAGG